MRFVDLIRLALSSLAQHKVRTVLTTLGILFGSSVMLFSLSMGQGVQATIEREYQRYAGLQNIEVYPGSQAPSQKIPRKLLQFPKDISKERRQRLEKEITRRWEQSNSSRRVAITREGFRELEKLPHVVAVKPTIVQYPQVVYRSNKEYAQTLAVPANEETLRQRIVQGEMYQSGDQAALLSEHLLHRLGVTTEQEVKAIIGQEIKLEIRLGGASPMVLLSLMGRQSEKVSSENEKLIQKMLKELPQAVDGMNLSPEEKKSLQRLFAAKPSKPDSTTKLITTTLQVAGVFRAAREEEIKRRHGGLFRDVDIAIPPEAALDFFFQSEQNRKRGVDYCLIEVDHVDHVKEVVALVEEKGLNSRSLVELIEKEQFTYLMIFACMTLIAVVTLLVAALGITNTMFMSVLERVREIGIMKAVGAGDQDIRKVFLVEGVMIGVTGGLLGLLLGYLGSIPADAWARSMVESRLSIQLQGSIFAFPGWILIGVPTLACVVTTLAAYFPARRASKINPVTALRHE